MINLAIPGLVMVVCEWYAFDILIAIAGRFGPRYIASCSIMMNAVLLAYQFPLAIAMSSTTRISNYIGAGLVEPAKTTARVVCKSLPT